MRTPNVFLGSDTPRQHVCRACGTVFEHRRRGGNIFCSATCNSSFGGEARTVLHFLRHQGPNGLTPQAVLDFVTQKPSRLKSADVTGTWGDLDELDRLLVVPGPSNPLVRQDIKLRADGIRSQIEAKSLPNQDELRQYVRALEILRDAGSETQQELRLRQSQAWAVVRYYLNLGELPGLARSLHCFANASRLLGDQRTNWKMIRYARHVIEESRVPLSTKARLVLLVVTTFDMRACGEGYGESHANSMPAIVRDLAASIDTPFMWVPTWGELAGYYRMRGDIERAEECLAKFDALKQIVPVSFIDLVPSFRPKIELYLDRDRDRAVDLIEREYLPAYRANPRELFRGHLQRWSRKLGISIPNVDVKTYETPVVFYMPRGEL